jgi:hypothetical protein
MPKAQVLDPFLIICQLFPRAAALQHIPIYVRGPDSSCPCTMGHGTVLVLLLSSGGACVSLMISNLSGCLFAICMTSGHMCIPILV